MRLNQRVENVQNPNENAWEIMNTKALLRFMTRTDMQVGDSNVPVDRDHH